MKVGDWVQATAEISESDFQGEALFIHARIGGVGHILEVLEDEWLNVFFERTGTVSICERWQVKQLGDAATGRLAP